MVSRVLKNEHQQLITPTTPWAGKQCLCVLKERGGCSPQPTTYPEIVGFLQNSTPLENNTLLVYPQHLPKETWRSPPSYTYRMSEASRAWGGGGAAEAVGEPGVVLSVIHVAVADRLGLSLEGPWAQDPLVPSCFLSGPSCRVLFSQAMRFKGPAELHGCRFPVNRPILASPPPPLQSHPPPTPRRAISHVVYAPCRIQWIVYEVGLFSKHRSRFLGMLL